MRIDESTTHTISANTMMWLCFGGGIMSKWEIKPIEGMCVSKERMHYHTAIPDEAAKEWYLNARWAVSVKQCHEHTVPLARGNPYFDWGME